MKNTLNSLFILVILFGCRISPDDNQLNLVMPGDPRSLNPAYSTDVRSGQICALLYDNLVRFDHGTDILPGLADQWKISKDGLTYTFHLKNNVRFTNGSKFTSEHVKQSFERILQPETNSPRTWLFKNVVGAESFRQGNSNDVSGFITISDSVFVIRLEKPFSPFLGFLAMPAAAITLEDYNSEILGTGPWKLIDRMADGHLLFEKNPDYFLGSPNFEKLKIRILPETLPRSADFITGYLDIMEIPDAEYELWINDEKWNDQIYHQNQLNVFYIGLNCDRPPFNDVNVRQAVNFAVDVKSILKFLFNGRGTPASGPIPPELLHETFQYYTFDTLKAKALLTQAGFENGFKVNLWQSQSQSNSLVTEIIQSQLSKVGIQVNIHRNDWNMFTQAIREGTPDMYYRSWYADYPDAENFIAPLFESSISKTRWNRYENPKLDTLIRKIQSESEITERQKLLISANEIITKDAPWIFLWHSQTAYAVNPEIKNWQPSVMFNAEKYINIRKEPSPIN